MATVYERTFDLDGRIKTVTLGPATAIYAELSQLFGYDSLSRLITATLAAGQTRDEGGRLTGEYDSEGVPIQETV